MWRSAREYLPRVWGTWWALLLGGAFGVVVALRELRVLPDSIRLPVWLWLLLALLCFFWAQFAAFHAVRWERDEARRERDEARRGPTPEPEPVWMSLADYQARAARIRAEWETKIPTPEDAQKYLGEGWERDEIDGRPIIVGGTLDRPAHWPVRRRPAGYGLSENARAALVAMRSNTDPIRGFRYITGGPGPRLVTSSREWTGSIAMDIRDELLGRGLARDESQEYGVYILTPQGREEAERLLRAWGETHLRSRSLSKAANRPLRRWSQRQPQPQRILFMESRSECSIALALSLIASQTGPVISWYK